MNANFTGWNVLNSTAFLEPWLQRQRHVGQGHGQRGSVTALTLHADCEHTTGSPRRRDRVVCFSFSSAALSQGLFVLCLWSRLQNQSCLWFSPVPGSIRVTDFTSKDHNAPVSVRNYCSSTSPLRQTVGTKNVQIDAEVFTPTFLTMMINTLNLQELSVVHLRKELHSPLS